MKSLTCVVFGGTVLLAGVLTGCNSLTPASGNHDFGKVLVGATSSPAQLNWTNSTANAITVQAWRVPAAPFAAQVPQPGETVAPNATTSATVTFAPTVIGKMEDQVRPITVPSSQRVRVSGEGVMFMLQGAGLGTTGVAANTAPLDFGRKLINAAPPAILTFTITNNTTVPMNLVARVVGGALVFGVQNANITVPARDGSTMPPTPGTATVTLTFAPTAVGEQLGAVELTGAPNLKIGVSLKGTGVAGEGE
ncbi:MAG TPA: choice-of-anchor D domain-containing protein [Phycisphaerales bacterium]|nr:choice-of-anchor D domain-containing protein [Phycisphaerales bacterium]